MQRAGKRVRQVTTNVAVAVAAAAMGRGRLVMRVREDVPEHGLRAGDRITVDGGAAAPVTVWRACDRGWYGIIAGLAADGVIDPEPDETPRPRLRLIG